MAKLAIKGHKTRGKEVIEILKMLGGINRSDLDGSDESCWYYIDEKFLIVAWYANKTYSRFTLEEFLEKFPYKVGDKVLYKSDSKPSKIKKLAWIDNKVEYDIEYWNGIFLAGVRIEDLHSYVEQIKEKDMEEIKQAEIRERIVLPFGKDRMEIVVNDDCELVNEDGKMFVVRKKPQYPKTVEDCLKVMGLTMNSLCNMTGYTSSLLMRLQQLLICRDAYWKLAGDWRLDYDADELFFISNEQGCIIRSEGTIYYNTILSFPTPEMSDTFYENFKDLIEECKELL